MIVNPIIPIWGMAIISIFFLLLKRKGIGNYIRQIFIVILLFVINMRIMVPDGDVPTVTQNVDVVFVVDDTISMLAEDYNGNERRMDAVKKDCKYIVEQLPGMSFSIIKFADRVEQLLPYTVDGNMVVETIGLLHGTSRYHAQGTSLNNVLGQLDKFLERGKGSYKIIFFISDGEVVSSDKLKKYENLNQYVDGGAVLGYGTKEGGPMKSVESWEEEEQEYLYIYNDDYEKVNAISKLDEENLKSIAADFGVEYVHMTETSKIDATLKKLQEEINELDIEKDMGSKEGYADIYYVFVIPLVVLLLMEVISHKKKSY